MYKRQDLYDVQKGALIFRDFVDKRRAALKGHVIQEEQENIDTGRDSHFSARSKDKRTVTDRELDDIFNKKTKKNLKSKAVSLGINI